MNKSLNKPLRYKYFPNGDIDYFGSGIVVEDEKSFEFEKIDWKSWGKFTLDNWDVPIYTGIIYICVIFGIQYLMKDKKAFQLNGVLFFWNAGIGIYSILAFSRMGLPFFKRLFSSNGFYSSSCIVKMSPPTVFWTSTFVFSKFVELGDTVLIVLRKKPLLFLQWYHHISTLAACFLCYGYFEPVNQYFAVINLGVHSVMYPYFALMALGIKIPRILAKLITTLQLSQMIIGFWLNFYSAYLYHTGIAPCLRHPSSINIFSFLYGTFIIIFGNLYYKIVFSTKTQLKRD